MGKSKITQNQYMFIVLSSMLAIGILSMASDLCKTAKQNGWIPILIGALYPLFVLITASIIDNKTNHASFWEFSNKIYGKKLTYIFSIVFLFYFLTIFSSIISGFSHVLIISITPFFEPSYIILPCLILIAFISLSGIKMVGRMCEFYFYITLPLLIITLCVIPTGSITNIKPIDISLSEMSSSIKSTFYAFSGCEISYFIISNISNNKNTKKAGIITCLIILSIYIFNVFMVIYALGWELTSKLDFPLLYVIQSIEIPIISNFMSIVIFLWSAIVLKSLLTYSYTTSKILSNLINQDYKKVVFIVLALVYIYTFFMIPQYNRKLLIDTTMPYFIGFTFIWALITTIIVSIKYRGVKK